MKPYDEVIVGGGIHGAGVLQAAVAAGHDALLIERASLARAVVRRFRGAFCPRRLKPRVLGIYGGKLTGWRAAAAHVLERISTSLPSRPRRAATDQLILRRPS